MTRLIGCIPLRPVVPCEQPLGSTMTAIDPILVVKVLSELVQFHRLVKYV